MDRRSRSTERLVLRYVFNTMQNSSLAADFKVPDLIQAIANKREGAFGSVIHGAFTQKAVTSTTRARSWVSFLISLACL